MRRHEILRTNSPDTALQAMAEFGATQVLALPGQPFHIKVDAIKLPHVRLKLGHHGAGTNTIFDTTDNFWQSFVVSGSCSLESEGSTVMLDSKNWSSLVEPHRHLERKTSPGYQQLTVCIGVDAVKSLLSSWLGEQAPRFNIEQQASVHSPMLQSMRRSMFFLASELDAIEPNCSDVALREFEQTMMLSFLLGHRHNYTSSLLRQPAAPSPSQLEMIEDYIEANWDKQLDVQSLADISNVSARSIFRYFRERRGSSPHQFIRRVRLQRARDMLIADEQSSVISVALRAGFSSLGHFARNYRAVFGEKPSETARRARERSGITRKRANKV